MTPAQTARAENMATRHNWRGHADHKPAAPVLGPLKVRRIIAEICEEHGISEANLKGPYRDRIFARPRQECYARLYAETTLSYPGIGRIMGDRDHTTIMHGVSAHRARQQNGETT